MSKTPHIFLPYQGRWVADTATVKVIEKSRRIGLSWCEAADDVLYAAGPTGQDVFYIGYNQDMAQEFIRDCTFWADKFNLVAGNVNETLYTDEKADILMYELRFKSGNRIKALSSRPTNLRGKQGRVIIDEAAFHDDLAGLMKAAIALLIWGGSVRVISTHDGIDSEFASLCNDIRAGKKDYSIHKVTILDAMADGLYERICYIRGIEYTKQGEQKWLEDLIKDYGDDADEELHCIPKKSGGEYINRAVIENCMDKDSPVVRLELDADFFAQPASYKTTYIQSWCNTALKPLINTCDTGWQWFIGEDFGRNADLTVIAPLGVNQSMHRVVPWLVELRNIPFDQQREILFYVCDNVPNIQKIALDQGGNGQYMAEKAAERYTTRAETIALSEHFYREHMPALKSALQDSDISIPRDLYVLSDLQAIELINGVPKLPKAKTQPRKKGEKPRHGDSAIALLLALYASRGKVNTGRSQRRGRVSKVLSF